MPVRGSAEALVFVDGDETHQMGERKVLSDLDAESFRECWSSDDEESQCVSLTCGDGVRIHGVIRTIIQGQRVIALSRQPQFASMRLALDHLVEAASRGPVAEAAEVALAVVSRSAPSVQGERDSLCRLSGTGIVRAWIALLLESRIVLRASTRQHLAPLAASLACCAEPVEYAHVYAPVLPSSDAVELLSAPVPFFVGVDDRDRAAWNKKNRGVSTFDARREDSLLLRDDCQFEATMLEDGVVVIDADRGETLWPETMTKSLGSLAKLDELSRKVGRILRDGGSRDACDYLQALTRALFAPRRPVSNNDAETSVTGRLFREDAAATGATTTTTTTCWAEFDRLALWIYPKNSEKGTKSSRETGFSNARDFPCLWLPTESLESVSPLDAIRFELTTKNDGLTWSDDATKTRDSDRSCRFVFEAPDEASCQLWASSLEVAITKKSTRRRLEEASETARFRDAVVRTQDARLMLKRRSEKECQRERIPKQLPEKTPRDEEASQQRSPVRHAFRELFFSGASKSTPSPATLLGKWTTYGGDSPEAANEPTSPRSTCKVLRSAIEKGSAAAAADDLESPQASPTSIRRSESRKSTDSLDRMSTAASENDAGREVLIQRPRLLISLCTEEEVVASSGALNVSCGPLSESERRRAIASSKTHIGASLWRTNQVVVALLDRLVATVRLTSSVPATLLRSETSSPSPSPSPLRVVPRRKLFDDDDDDDEKDGVQEKYTRLDAVRSSTGFAAFEEASSLLNRIDAETLARDDDEKDDEKDAARIAFWINVHNLAVLHACIARHPPPTTRGPSLVVRYYSWSRSHKYAVGGLVLSIFQIEHAILRARSSDKNQATGWISDLARFGKNDDRSFLSPGKTSIRELGFALFAATKSSSPLTVFRATSKAGFEAELRVQAAKSLARWTRVESRTNPVDSRDQQRAQKSFVVVLPPVMRWYSGDWGKTNLDVLKGVHALLEKECGDARLARVVAASRDDSLSQRHVSWPSSRHNNAKTATTAFSLKFDYPVYDWTPHLALS